MIRDWLGADARSVLGQAFPEIPLIRSPLA